MIRITIWIRESILDHDPNPGRTATILLCWRLAEVCALWVLVVDQVIHVYCVCNIWSYSIVSRCDVCLSVFSKVPVMSVQSHQKSCLLTRRDCSQQDSHAWVNVNMQFGTAYDLFDLLCIGDVTEPANIRIRRMRISCSKSVGFGCGCGFVVQSKLSAILATAIQLSYYKKYFRLWPI